MKILLTVFAMFGTVSTAAADTCFSAHLSTCQIDLTDNTLSKIDNKLPGVRVATAPGKIVLYCPIYNTTGVERFNTNDAGRWGHMRLLAEDPDQSGTEHGVQASLESIERNGSSLSTIVQINTSTSGGGLGGNPHEYGVNLADVNLNFLAFDYLFKVSVNRANSEMLAIARSVALCPGKI